MRDGAPLRTTAPNLLSGASVERPDPIQQPQQAEAPLTPQPETKSQSTSYAFWCLCLVGLAGIHRIYNGKTLSGILWLLTGGLCGIGQIVDLFLIPGMVDDANRNA